MNKGLKKRIDRVGTRAIFLWILMASFLHLA
jgi:hypothetical protein